MESQITDVTVLPEVNEHVQYGLEAISYAEQIAVESMEDLEAASGMRQAIKDRVKAVNSLLDPFVKAAHSLHKAHTTRRNEITKPLDEAENILNKKMVVWQITEDKRLIAEQLKADEDAKLEAVDKALKDGNEELAEAYMEDQVPVVSAPVEKAKPSGVSFTETYDFEIIKESDLPRSYMKPNEVAIRAVVKAQKDKTNIPGVRVFAKKGVKSKPTGMTKRGW